jgi:hypothetical protein
MDNQSSPLKQSEGGFLSGLSSFMENAAGPIGIGMSLASTVFGAVSAKKAQRRARIKERKARKEMNALKDQYAALDTSNPYMNMENTMEDLTVNQQQAQFEREQFQQSQANILGGLRGAAGGSGIAALAQSLAQQGQLASQRSSASIGQQEAANQRAAAQQAAAIQAKEREGEVYSRDLERQKVSTLLGMSKQETAAHAQAKAAAKAAKMQAITGGITGMADMFAGFGDETDTVDYWKNRALNKDDDDDGGK